MNYLIYIRNIDFPYFIKVRQIDQTKKEDDNIPAYGQKFFIMHQ